ncbi:MAG: TonB family protein [Blastocatellia bacterium]|nr:TonB family protein [Blastocatellia bacterium]
MFRMRMKNVAAVAFVLAGAVISGAAQDQRQPDSQPAAPAQSDLIGKKAIDFALNDLDGNKVELQSFRGKVVLLIFWDTRCRPAVTALPEIEELSKDFKDKGVVALGVDSENAQVAREFVKNKGYSFATLIDEGKEVERKYEASAMPHFFIIDRKGKIKWRLSGYSPADRGNRRSLRNAVEMVLKGMDPPRAYIPSPPMPPDVSEALSTPSNKALLARVIKREKVIFPREVGEAAKQGVVAVEVTVSESGKVIEARAVSGPELMREPAIRAAKQWEFSPAEAPAKGILVFTLATATYTKYRY